mgnify:CR=1 FL=1
MASLPECEQALHDLAARLAEVPANVRGKYVVDRTLAKYVEAFRLLTGKEPQL